MTNIIGRVAPFNPGTLTQKELESLWVGREEETATLIGRITVAAKEGTAPPQQLVIAPRGYGKTHMLHIIYHKLKNNNSLKKKLVIAMLREEEHVHNYLDFLRRILKAIKNEYDKQELKEAIEYIYENPSDNAINDTEDFLKQFIGDRLLVVMTENLGEIFEGMGKEGQRRLRAYLHESRNVSLLATAQRLFEPVKVRTSPFYGFFERTTLEPFDEKLTFKLIKRISENQDKKDLINFLKTPIGKARVSAVTELTGGNPRLITLFSGFLDAEKLEELTKTFMEFVEISLTPYYQEQMGKLSPLHRRIVELLCEKGDGEPKTVKEIARRALTSSQSISSQLRKMLELGILFSTKKGRESYYGMLEPLWRVSIEVKNSREGILPIVVNFIKLIKTPKDIFDEIVGTDKGSQVFHKHWSLALKESIESMGTKDKDGFVKNRMLEICEHLPDNLQEAIKLIKPLADTNLIFASALLDIFNVIGGQENPEILKKYSNDKFSASQALNFFMFFEKNSLINIKKEKRNMLLHLKYFSLLYEGDKHTIEPLQEVITDNPLVLGFTAYLMDTPDQVLGTKSNLTLEWLLELSRNQKKWNTLIKALGIIKILRPNAILTFLIPFLNKVNAVFFKRLLEAIFDKIAYQTEKSGKLAQFFSITGKRLDRKSQTVHAFAMGRAFVKKDEEFTSLWERNRETILKAVSEWKEPGRIRKILLAGEAYSKGVKDAIADWPIEFRKQFEKAKAEADKNEKSKKKKRSPRKRVKKIKV